MIFASLKKTLISSLIAFAILIINCSSSYYLDAPVNDRIMFADNTQNSDLSRVEDGGLVGSVGECPT